MDMKRDDVRDGEGMECKTRQQCSTAIPDDILRKILVRFPVKTLAEFMCVCRSWRTLISDPIFVDKHVRASIQDKGYAHHRLILISECRPFDVKSCSLPSVLREESPTIDDHYYRFKSLQPTVQIVGSANGLVCISSSGFVFVWNPTTGKSKRLPNCEGSGSLYGFGYDEGSSDYKVVNLIRSLTPSMTEVMIYGLKSGSWRKIDQVLPNNFPLQWNATAVFLNGSLHWPGGAGIGYFWMPILTFDLLTETSSLINQPLYWEDANDIILGVLCDCLCVLCNMGKRKVVAADVWVMKEYGKEESWSKMFSIPYFPFAGKHRRFYAPLCISFRENEVLLSLGSSLVSYNIISNRVYQTDIHNCGSKCHWNCLKAYTYIESMVSPFPEQCSGEMVNW